jgi:hypothetical protein
MKLLLIGVELLALPVDTCPFALLGQLQTTDKLGNTAAVSIIGSQEFKRPNLNEVLLGMACAFRACAERQRSTIDFCSLSLQVHLFTCRNSRYRMTAEKGPVLENDITNKTANNRLENCVPKVWISILFHLRICNIISELRASAPAISRSLKRSHPILLFRKFWHYKTNSDCAVDHRVSCSEQRTALAFLCLLSCVISPLVCVPQPSKPQKANEIRYRDHSSQYL